MFFGEWDNDENDINYVYSREEASQRPHKSVFQNMNRSLAGETEDICRYKGFVFQNI